MVVNIPAFYREYLSSDPEHIVGNNIKYNPKLRKYFKEEKKFLLVDEEDKKLFSDLLWIVSKKNFPHTWVDKAIKYPSDLVYGERKEKERTVFLDGNPLNCSRINMKRVTYSEMGYIVSNKKKRGNVGVYKSGHPRYQWLSRISEEGQVVHLGYFDSIKKAALVYDYCCRIIHGENAFLNYPDIKITKSTLKSFGPNLKKIEEVTGDKV